MRKTARNIRPTIEAAARPSEGSVGTAWCERPQSVALGPRTGDGIEPLDAGGAFLIPQELCPEPLASERRRLRRSGRNSIRARDSGRAAATGVRLPWEGLEFGDVLAASDDYIAEKSARLAARPMDFPDKLAY